MDKSQIITLVVNAVFTILTTAIVVRLSLNKGKLGLTNTVKARLTPKFKAYTKLIFSVLVLMRLTSNLYVEVMNPALPTRFDVLLIIMINLGLIMWGGLFFRFAAELSAVKRGGKAH